MHITLRTAFECHATHAQAALEALKSKWSTLSGVHDSLKLEHEQFQSDSAALKRCNHELGIAAKENAEQMLRLQSELDETKRLKGQARVPVRHVRIRSMRPCLRA